MMLDMLGDSMWFLMLFEMVCRCSLPRWRLGCGAAYCPTPLPRVGAWWVRGPGRWRQPCRGNGWNTESVDLSFAVADFAPKVEPSLLDFHHRARPQMPRSASPCAETRTGTAACPSAQEGPGKSVRRRKKPGFKVGLQLPIASGCQNSSDIREWAEAGCGESTPYATTLLGSNVLWMTVEIQSLMCRLLARLDNGNMQRRWTITESKNPWLLCVLGVSFFPIYVIRGLGLNIEPCKNRHTENLWNFHICLHIYIYWVILIDTTAACGIETLAKGKVSAQDSKTDDLPQAGKRTTKTTATWLVFFIIGWAC